MFVAEGWEGVYDFISKRLRGGGTSVDLQEFYIN